MSLLLTPKVYDVIPSGTYKVKFASAERGQGEFGETLKWYFEIVEGKYAGRKVSKLTGMVPTKKNSCGDMLVSLHGKLEPIDLDLLVGSVYHAVLIHNADTGYTNIKSIWGTDNNRAFDDIDAIVETIRNSFPD